MPTTARARRPSQPSLPLPPTWGGKRAGAGRKPTGARAGVPHRTRPYHDRAQPVHLTLRAVATLPNLREARVFPAIREAIRHGSWDRFRIVHFSVQHDHLHLLVEARDRLALTRGARGLAVRLAHAINRALRRKGQVFADRYHTHSLTTPREVRNALVYVLNNARKHRGVMREVDLCSSAPWFAGWRTPPRAVQVEKPVVDARTWLLTHGWRKWGLLAPDEAPRSPG